MIQIFKFSAVIILMILASCKNDNHKQSRENHSNSNDSAETIDSATIDDYTDKIDSLIKRTRPRTFNGVIQIAQQSEIKYSRNFGYSNFENKTALTGDEHFLIKSNSKQVTAVLILKEVEKGNVELDAPVSKYLPKLTQSWKDSVTVHQLLNFSSGITSIDRPLAFKPGSAFRYGVTTYTMLANILENVTGETYINLANTLFEDLNMDNSYCYEEDKIHPDLINGYINTNNTFTIRELPKQGQAWIDHIPAGGLVSNAKDLLIWDTKLHKGKILKPESYNQMISYDITDDHEVFGNEKIGYGYGVRVKDKTSPICIGHGGKGMGFVCVKVYFPENDVSLIVWENQYHEDNDLAYFYENSIREIVANSNLVK